MNEEIIAEIKRRILTLIVDNPCLAIVQTQLETAALIGASVALELKTAEEFQPSIPSELDLDEAERRFYILPDPLPEKE